MATDLGKAYVQIMPSAKGISGSIQKAINPEATAAGKSAGKNLITSMSKSMGDMGKTLTKRITLPVAGAATAVGGLVGALGFKRLVGLDTAQAKLKGLGYNAEEVEKISSQVESAIMGGMTTMGEGVAIAAGGLAAGVKEGAELEKYIKLVGDAAVGANRPVDEMAQIFNRVQGGGRLMTQELNMIEMGLPGFAQAMADELADGSLEAFREMVTNGEVGSEEFLDVMDDFAGGMADAYSESWEGMAKNTLAYVGIIGESLLEGLFEDGKEGLANLIELLKSDEVLDWATETGEKIREIAGKVVDVVKTLMDWWTNLSSGAQKLIGIVSGIAVVLGPVLVVASKLITAIMTASQWIGIIKAGVAALGTALSGLSAPVLAVIAVIAGLVAIFVTLYKKNERFREVVNTAWEAIKETISVAIQAVTDFVMEIFGGLVDWWNENNELIKETISTVWSAIQSVITNVLDVIVPIIKTAWEGVKNNIEAVWNVIKTVIETAINVVKGVIKTVMQLITGDWQGAWDTIRSTTSNLMSGIKNIISSVLNAAATIVRTILNTIKSVFSSVFNALRSTVSGAFNRVRTAVKTGMRSAFNAIKGFLGRFKDAGKNIITAIADGIKGAIGKVTGAIGNVASKIRDFLPFSPPKVGPLMDIMDVKWGETIGGGIEKGEDKVAKAMDNILSTPYNPRHHKANGDRNEDVSRLLIELIRAVKEGKNIVMNDRVVGNILEPYITEKQDRNKRVRDSFV